MAEMVKNAGQDALHDPAVQQKIVDVCKEKFPEYAGAAKDQVVAWAKDPAVQAKAKEVASRALDLVAGAGSRFMNELEQGPAGVRVLAAIGSLASVANAVFSVVNVVGAFTHVILYTISVYQLIFGLTTFLFELPPTWLETIQDKTRLPISSYQDMLMTNCKFLSQVCGRGLFYIFQGTLWLAFASMTELLDLAVGFYLIFMGVIHIAMYFGIVPQTVSEKMRQGYRQITGPADSQPSSAMP